MKPNPNGFCRCNAMAILLDASLAPFAQGRVMQYFQQLAIITPYAELDIRFSSPEQPLRSFAYQWKRRSTKMPPQAQEIRHHPASVNNLIVRRLMDQFQQLQANRKGGSGKATLGKFLTHAFSNVTSPAAKKVITAAGCGLTAATPVESMDSRQVHALTARLRSHPFPRPSGWCLSPAGEYNLRLGIMKEMGPHLLATHATSALAFEGHPFVVEAGVALGGRLSREGISVYRFANRIPLLFEAGGDVVTKTATQRIKCVIRWRQWQDILDCVDCGGEMVFVPAAVGVPTRLTIAVRRLGCL